MKSQSPQKIEKASTLSLYLQRHELQLGICSKSQLGQEQIQDEVIKIQSKKQAKIIDQGVEQKYQVKSHFQEKNTRNDLTMTNDKRKVEEKIENHCESEDEEEQKLLQMCSLLSGQVEGLRAQKFEHAISQFAVLSKKQVDSEYLQEKSKIEANYSQKEKDVLNLKKAQQLKLSRSLEEINKLQNAYKLILSELQERKEGIQKQHAQARRKALQHKDKLTGEWKRASNQQIRKILATVSLL